MARLDAGEMAYEDATPYVLLRGCLESLASNPQIRHVFIDEMQDYTPIQFALINRLFPWAKTTLLGDPHQAIYDPTETTNDLNSIAAVFDNERVEKATFLRTYRSTKPIADFARSLLPDEGVGIEPFDREGPKPEVVVSEDDPDHLRTIAELIDALDRRNRRTIAVICKTAAESIEAYHALKQLVPNISYVDRNTVRFPSGALVVPSYLAKGIEFDAVIVYDASERRYNDPSERKLLYTVCTRAMHELIICAVKKLTPFIKAT